MSGSASVTRGGILDFLFDSVLNVFDSNVLVFRFPHSASSLQLQSLGSEVKRKATTDKGQIDLTKVSHILKLVDYKEQEEEEEEEEMDA
jgi:hypothetical protein